MPMPIELQVKSAANPRVIHSFAHMRRHVHGPCGNPLLRFRASQLNYSKSRRNGAFDCDKYATDPLNHFACDIIGLRCVGIQ